MNATLWGVPFRRRAWWVLVAALLIALNPVTKTDSAHADPPANNVTMSTCDEINAYFAVPVATVDAYLATHMPPGWHDRYEYLLDSNGNVQLVQFVSWCADQTVNGVTRTHIARSELIIIINERPGGPANFADNCCNLYILEWGTNNPDWVNYLQDGPIPIPQGENEPYAKIKYVPDMDWSLDITGSQVQFNAPAPNPSPFTEQATRGPLLVPSFDFANPATSPLALWLDSPQGPVKIGITSSFVTGGSVTGTINVAPGSTLATLLGSGPHDFIAQFGADRTDNVTHYAKVLSP